MSRLHSLYCLYWTSRSTHALEYRVYTFFLLLSLLRGHLIVLLLVGVDRTAHFVFSKNTPMVDWRERKSIVWMNATEWTRPQFLSKIDCIRLKCISALSLTLSLPPPSLSFSLSRLHKSDRVRKWNHCSKCIHWMVTQILHVLYRIEWIDKNFHSHSKNMLMVNWWKWPWAIYSTFSRDQCYLWYFIFFVR